MKCLIIFGSDNAHPLAWLLSKARRHVWCALRDDERGVWVSYNWHKGLPIIQAEAAATYDLQAHYRDQGFEVLEIDRGEAPVSSGLMLNNCVGHTKIVAAISSASLTPNQLYKFLTARRRGSRAMSFLRYIGVPGFGSSSPSPPPPPAPLPPPPTRADPSVVKARTDAQRRLRQARGMAGTQVADQSALAATAQTANKTLLGN
jgi:hypothetical protein